MITPEQLASSNTEHGHQTALFAWIAQQRNHLLATAFAIPNGGERNKAVAGKLKAEGVKAGVPDIFLPVARNDRPGLFIEMKKPSERPKRTESKGGCSDEQIAWHFSLRTQGYVVAVCYDWQEARDAMLAYLK